MLEYLAWRLLRIVPIVLLVVTLIFVLFRLVPGDPARLIAGATATQESVERVRTQLGLDRPVIVQYLAYVGGFFEGRLGYSGIYRDDVGPVIVRHLGPTLALLASAIVLTIVIGIPAGAISAVYRGGAIDQVVSFLVTSMLSIPNFWLGLMMISVFSVTLGWLPSFGYGDARSLVMPTIAVAARMIAIVARMTRSSLLEVLQRDYVRTARAKGLRGGTVLYKHAMRNALIPTITTIGLQAGYLLGGSVVIEQVFAWPGLGQLLINSVGVRDFNMIQSITVVFAAGFLLINLVVDVLYVVVNPRIEYR
ncbi:MAG: ABC transporter permease [Trueperaceae bacterium]|nr:ABC transporter permease [Trueperaceae bacterium]